MVADQGSASSLYLLEASLDGLLGYRPPCVPGPNGMAILEEHLWRQNLMGPPDPPPAPILLSPLHGESKASKPEY